MTFLAATGSEVDPHRKPKPLMWEIFCERLNGKTKIDRTLSFYCGDAAGRKGDETRLADFSDDDKKFAENIGLRFLTPEQ